MSKFSTVPLNAETPATIAQIHEEYLGLNDTDKREFFGLLSKTKKKELRKRLEEFPDLPANPAKEDDADESDVEFPEPTPTTTVVSKPNQKTTEISDDQLRDMWTLIESMSTSEIDPEDLRVFEYEGFNPSAILRALMVRMIDEKISKDQFKKDIMTLCGVAIIKGSVNNDNYKKMKPKGQEVFQKLQERYSIKLGSAKGLDSSVVTVSRIAASFPGVIIDLLLNQKVEARVFGGPMKSSKLPAPLRHQAMAACIPRSLDDGTKNFLLGCVAAYSVDQSLTISSKRKPKKEDVVRDQANFVRVAHQSAFPTEGMRNAIFKKVTWDKYMDEMTTCAKEFEKLDDSFGLVDMPTLKADISKI